MKTQKFLMLIDPETEIRAQEKNKTEMQSPGDAVKTCFFSPARGERGFGSLSTKNKTAYFCCFTLTHSKQHWAFTGSQDHSNWKEHQEVSGLRTSSSQRSQLWGEVMLHRASSSHFKIPRLETAHHLWSACATAWLFSQKNSPQIHAESLVFILIAIVRGFGPFNLWHINLLIRTFKWKAM